MVVTVNGPQFAVNSPNAAVTWEGGKQKTVSWTVGGGVVAPTVNILLSRDGGASYETGTATMLSAGVPNDGSQEITVPNIDCPQARIIVEAVGNVFFDVSNTSFSITKTIPKVASVTVNPTSVTGGENVIATVKLDIGAPEGGTVVDLVDSSPNYCSLPPTLAFAQGQKEGTVNVTTSQVPWMTYVVITAKVQNTVSQTALLTICPKVWDVARDWRFTTNPDGEWAYGMKSAPGSPLTLYDGKITYQNLPLWTASAITNFGTPCAGLNAYGTQVPGIPVGAFFLHPSEQGHYSVARWRSPFNGRIDIQAHFGAGDIGIVSCFVEKNGATLAGIGATSSDFPFAMNNVAVRVGDVIDFTVGMAGDFYSDSTPLMAVIRKR